MTAELPLLKSTTGTKKSKGKDDKKKVTKPNAKSPKRNDTVINIPLSAHIPGRPVNTSSMALIRQIVRYDKQGFIPHTERVLDGFKADSLHENYGTQAEGASGEIVVVDRSKDPVLRATINEFKQQATKWSGASDVEKAQRTKDFVNSKMTKPAETVQNQEILLGDLLAENKGVYRHKALMFKVLGDEIGVKSDVKMGKHGEQAHAWNMVYLEGGKRLAVDPVLDLTQNDKQLAGNYWYENKVGSPVYATQETKDIMKPISQMKPGEDVTICQQKGEQSLCSVEELDCNVYDPLANVCWDKDQDKFFIKPSAGSEISIDGIAIPENQLTELPANSEIGLAGRQLRFHDAAIRNNNAFS